MTFLNIGRGLLFIRDGEKYNLGEDALGNSKTLKHGADKSTQIISGLNISPALTVDCRFLLIFGVFIQLNFI